MSLEAAVTVAGGRFLGEAHGIVWFTDPETQSTLALPAAEVTPDNVTLTIMRSRRTFRQEQFRLLIEGLQDYAIFMLDPAGTIVSWNAGAERLFQYPARDIIGRALSLLFFPEEQQTGSPQKQLDSTLRENRYEDELLLRRRDDSGFWGDMVITVLRDEAGQMRGYSFVCRDVTRRRYEQKKQRARLCAARTLSEDGSDSLQAPTRFLQCLCDHLQWDLGEYWEMNRRQDGYQLKAIVRNASFPSSLLARMRPPHPLTLEDAQPFLARTEPGPSLLRHIERDADFPFPCFAEQGMQTALMAPLRKHEQMTGFIILAHRRHYEAQGDEVALVEDLVHLLNRFLQQKQAEEELQLARDQIQEQASLLDQILNSSSDLIFMFDQEGRYQYLNQTAAAIFGRAPEEIMGKHWRQLEIPEHLMNRFDKERESVMRTGIPLRAEMTFPTVHDWRDFEYIVCPVRGREGTIESVVVTSRDITARKQEEERMKVMLEQLPAIVWTTDSELRFTSSLGAGLKALGLQPNQVIGMSIEDFGQGAPFEHASLEAHHKAMEGARITYRSFWKDRILDVWVQPLRGIDDAIKGTLGLALDITEQTAAESRPSGPPATLRSRETMQLEHQLLEELSTHLSITAAILEDALARRSTHELSPLLHVRELLKSAKDALDRILPTSQSTTDAA